MPVYIEKSGDLVGCHHSRTTTEKGKIELLSQWTMDGWDEQLPDEVDEVAPKLPNSGNWGFLCITILYLCFCNVFSVFVFLWALWQLPDEVDEVALKLPSSGNWGVLVQAKAERGDNKYSEHLATDHPLYLWVALQRNLQNNFFSSTREMKSPFARHQNVHNNRTWVSTFSSNLFLIPHKRIKQKPCSSNNSGSQADQRISGFPA